MKSFWIINHVSDFLRSGPFAEMVKLPPRPDFPTKESMLRWSHDDKTEHCYYNLCEPRDPLRRLTKDNAAAYLHGVVADFDVKNLTEEDVAKGIAKVPAEWPVSWVSRTFSGGARFVWLFDRPVACFNQDVAKSFLKLLAKEMKVRSLIAGWDEGAWSDPARYFELGTGWRKISDKVVPSSQVTHLMFDASNKVKWVDQGTLLPFEIVAAEVERRWPGRWQGPFAVGAQGVRFWDPQADNPKGAWIRETGVQAFTGEGRFLFWDEILGSEFVRRSETERIGSAVGRAYHDGQRYWLKSDEGAWKPYSLESVRLNLRHLGLQQNARRGEMSEVDRAVRHITFECGVDAVYPFLYRDEEVVSVNSSRYLNVSRVRPVMPSDGRHEWGQGFAWIAEYIDDIFDEEQKPFFLSWLAHYYKSAIVQRVRKGQAIFIAGGVGMGKTFLSHRVIGGLMGGSQDATNYLLGKTEFNGELLASPIMAIDDATANAEGKAHELYSQIIKKVVANWTLEFRKMYNNPVTMPWEGRVVVTMNSDPQSLRMLPNIEASILDKVSLFLAKPLEQGHVRRFGVDSEAIVRGELPAFGAFLRDYEVPEQCKGDFRFGVKSYQHPELVAVAKRESSTSSFSELLDLWRRDFFSGVTAPHWEGTPTELQRDMLDTDSVMRLMKSSNYNSVWIGRALSQLMSSGHDWIQDARTRNSRKYRILRPADAPELQKAG